MELRSRFPPKTAISSPFQGVLPPSGPQIIAESGSGRPTSWHPGNVGAPVPLATVLPSHAPRSASHAVTSGVRSCADPPPLAPA